MDASEDPDGPAASDEPRDRTEEPSDRGPPDAGESGTDSGDAESIEALRRQVEEKYDFEEFGPADMDEMTAEEWEVAFDPETWITGETLLDRVEADLKGRIADRDVFARLERHDDRVIAYSDTGYAVVYADGSVEGQGTVLRDVKPTVALASMESYDVPEDPPEELLPEPQEVPEGSGDLGNLMLQVVAGFQVLAGLLLLGAGLLVVAGLIAPPGGGTSRELNILALVAAGVAFIAIGVLLFAVVANARLSDKFRAEEYRNRLRAVDLEPGERPEFLPDDDGAPDAPLARGDEGRPTDGDDDRPAGEDGDRQADGDAADGSADGDRIEGRDDGSERGDGGRDGTD